MTREEAIILLCGLFGSYPLMNDERQAVEVAIEALENNEYQRGWHDAITKALAEVMKIHVGNETFDVVQKETLIGLGLSMDSTLQNNNTQLLENRLKHLLKSRYIAKFDEVNHATGEYVRNIEDADVCFVCDKKACKVCHPETCKYTSEPKFAINFERDGATGTFFEKLPDNLHWIEKSGLFVCPYCGGEHDTHFNFCGWCGKKVL